CSWNGFAARWPGARAGRAISPPWSAVARRPRRGRRCRIDATREAHCGKAPHPPPHHLVRHRHNPPPETARRRGRNPLQEGDLSRPATGIELATGICREFVHTAPSIRAVRERDRLRREGDGRCAPIAVTLTPESREEMYVKP